MANFIKSTSRAIGRYTLYLTRAIVRRLPYRLYKRLARIFFVFGKAVMINKRRIALQSLRIAFSREKSEDEIKGIAHKYFRNFGQGMVDLIYYADRPEMFKETMTIEGREHLDKALAKGNGVILTGGHFGNFILMYMKMVLEGYPTNVIMRRVRDEAFEDYITGLRNEHGIKTIYDLPARKCVTDCIRALRSNELLFILLDQNYGSAGRVFVDFFGQKAATATGPVVFSLRTKAPILPIFCIRDEKDDQHKLIIEPELELEEGVDEQDTIIRNVAKITKIIESYVRKYPHEWGGWVHRRWKSKPVHEQLIIDRLKGYKPIPEPSSEVPVP